MPAPTDQVPIALTAVSVAGQCRERSPADLALFGAGADRLIDRFVDPALGQGLLARVLTDGAAESVALLATPGGVAPFRVSLWRQRGGDRIRVLAAFALSGPVAPPPVPLAAGSVPLAALTRLGHDLRGPLAAVMGFAHSLRAAPGAAVQGLAGDILAASWRLMRLAEDLGRWGQGPGHGAPPAWGEVDLGRLVRRVLRLAGPTAEAAGVTLVGDDLPPRGEGAVVLADETGLWSALDQLVQAAIRDAGAGGEVRAALAGGEPGGDLVLTLARRDGAAARAAEPPAFALAEDVLAANGAALALDPTGEGMVARVTFPAARCIAPL